jgi:hypothetical protein
MEAGSKLRYFSFRPALTGILICLVCSTASAASKRTRNFIIQAPTPQLANAVAQAAEDYRRDLAVHWLGQALPPWPTPCPVRVIAGPNLAAQGVTTYNPAPVRDFQMEVVGTPQRILDSVLPHEVTHTILATYFGRPLPRWADEGICTTVEHVSERSKHEAKLREFLRSRRGIAMNQLFLMTEYPSDVLPMYAQGYSVCRFLIDQKGPKTFIQFLGDYMRNPSWTANVRKHYQYESLAELQQYWLAWVSDGSGSVDRFAKVQPTRAQPASLAAVGAASPNAAASASIRQPAAGDRVQPATATEIALAGSSPGQGRAASATPRADATRLASTNARGWYQRKKLDAQAPAGSSPASASSNLATAGSRTSAVSLGPTSSVGTPMVPPSVRNSGPYQLAHPQAEQQISRGGTPIYQPSRGSQFR